MSPAKMKKKMIQPSLKFLFAMTSLADGHSGKIKEIFWTKEKKLNFFLCRSIARGYFLGASADNLICSAKSPSDGELWYVHLAARPQVNLRSVGRKRFARLSEEQTEIQVEENVPWGENTLFTLEFREDENKYAIHTCNNMYLMRDGRLVPELSKVK